MEMMIMDQLFEFEAQIKNVLRQFEAAFGHRNPVPLRMQGKIPRTGLLPPDDVEYSIHGHGCTVERNGRTISFDFDKDGGYCYTAFKFGLFVDDDAIDDASIASEFQCLVQEGKLESIAGQGVRLAPSPSSF
jgi:hypothetical protein